MWVTVRHQNATEIDGSVVRDILNLYPEERLIERSVFSDAFAAGEIEFNKLQKEAEKIIIPWQMFFLSRENFEKQQEGIEEKRRYRVSARLMAKRPGQGQVTSRRIIDRLIRQQGFVCEQEALPRNTFCGSMKSLSTKAAASKLLQALDISREEIWKRASKESALEYLISKAEAANINVSRGVLTHKILPHHSVVPGQVYKNTSGFVIKDDCIPFVFLPSELNPNEVASRQIYSLVFLLAIIGLEQYGYFLGNDLKTSIVRSKGTMRRLHDITTEVLIPGAEVENLRGGVVKAHTRDSLSDRLKVSPSALITTLKLRGIITPDEAEQLMPPPLNLPSSSMKRTPKVSTAIQKFCGRHTEGTLQKALRTNSITNVQAQYLVFGAPNKKAFKKYKSEIGL